MQSIVLSKEMQFGHGITFLGCNEEFVVVYRLITIGIFALIWISAPAAAFAEEVACPCWDGFIVEHVADLSSRTPENSKACTEYSLEEESSISLSAGLDKERLHLTLLKKPQGNQTQYMCAIVHQPRPIKFTLTAEQYQACNGGVRSAMAQMNNCQKFDADVAG